MVFGGPNALDHILKFCCICCYGGLMSNSYGISGKVRSVPPDNRDDQILLHLLP